MSRFARSILALNAMAAALLVAVALADEEDERPPAAIAGDYVGVNRCKMCHFKQFKTWKGNRHPHAFDTLPEKYREDASCLKCHATGLGHPGGFKSLEETPKMAGVQCEMCHGPGQAHAEFMMEHAEEVDDEAVAKRGVELLVRGVERARSSCWKCHLEDTHASHPSYDK